MPLKKVDARAAGEAAIGILVPPGTRTFVVVRLRGLDWDLLPVRWTGDPAVPPTFASFGRDEAARVARKLASFLEDCDRDGVDRFETLGRDPAFQVWLREDDLRWLLCERTSEREYRPMVFRTLAAARDAAAAIAPLVRPGPDATRQYYFNTQNFS